MKSKYDELSIQYEYQLKLKEMLFSEVCSVVGCNLGAWLIVAFVFFFGVKTVIFFFVEFFQLLLFSCFAFLPFDFFLVFEFFFFSLSFLSLSFYISSFAQKLKETKETFSHQIDQWKIKYESLAQEKADAGMERREKTEREKRRKRKRYEKGGTC